MTQLDRLIADSLDRKFLVCKFAQPGPICFARRIEKIDHFGVTKQDEGVPVRDQELTEIPAKEIEVPVDLLLKCIGHYRLLRSILPDSTMKRKTPAMNRVIEEASRVSELQVKEAICRSGFPTEPNLIPQERQPLLNRRQRQIADLIAIAPPCCGDCLVARHGFFPALDPLRILPIDLAPGRRAQDRARIAQGPADAIDLRRHLEARNFEKSHHVGKRSEEHT